MLILREHDADTRGDWLNIAIAFIRRGLWLREAELNWVDSVEEIAEYTLHVAGATVGTGYATRDRGAKSRLYAVEFYMRGESKRYPPLTHLQSQQYTTCSRRGKNLDRDELGAVIGDWCGSLGISTRFSLLLRWELSPEAQQSLRAWEKEMLKYKAAEVLKGLPR